METSFPAGSKCGSDSAITEGPEKGGCCPGNGWNRRAFIGTVGASTLVTLGLPLPSLADSLDNPNFDVNIPADKKLDPDWVKSLFERGEPQVYKGNEISTIQMPIGGICAGHVYMSGDGRLNDWRVTENQVEIANGFTLRTVAGDKTSVNPLNNDAFHDITFRGEYPISKIVYAKADVPVQTTMEVFSPYEPLNADDSGLPATVFDFTLKNTSDAPVEATLAGSLQNAAYFFHRFTLLGNRQNKIIPGEGAMLLSCTAELDPPDGVEPNPRPDIIFENWDKSTFEGWTVEGTGFGAGPYPRDVIEKGPGGFGPLGGEGAGVVNSYFGGHGDTAIGKLTSAPFTVSRKFITAWIGGGDLEGKVGVNLVVDGKIVETQTGARENPLMLHIFDARPYEGKQATLEIFDNSSEGWAQIGVSRITFTDDSDIYRPDVVFEDWDRDTFGDWTVEGTAFGPGPILRTDAEKFSADIGGESPRIVNSYLPTHTDTAQGKLTSKPFTIPRRYIKAWVGGGDLQGKVGMNLLVDGKIVQSFTGAHQDKMVLRVFDTRTLEGKQGTFEIFDNSGDMWAQVGVGRISFSDSQDIPAVDPLLNDQGDMALALLGGAPEVAIAQGEIGFDGTPANEATVRMSKRLVGTLGRTVKLAPGESANITFVIAWHFANLHMERLGQVGRYYGKKFDSAKAVANYVTANFKKLAGNTRLWRDTWYDSTLPYWFLDRIFVNAATLATSGCYRFGNGRFYAWEGGAGCCPGTCTHVWQYAHSMSRLFPELERDTREHTDLGISLNTDTGVSGFRGEFDMSLAVDGQTGTIMRFYREHQMSPDDSWLKRNWEKIKLTYKPLMALDADRDGIMEGAQMNTLDQPWFGQISWMSSMYVGALRAGVEMATEMGDTAFADECRTIADAGTKNITSRLYNGEYYISLLDPNKPNTVNSGDGCHSDQVYGQSWACQIGLPRVLPEKETKSALASLWKYNFSPDAGAYFAAHTPPGRRYVVPGDKGMIVCTFPRTDWDYQQASGGGHNFAYYFVETWTGMEYQVAGHMFWEGMLLEPLAIIRAIHDRYAPAKRNPYSEEECGAHYSRAMSSHGAFIGICGYEHHGPKGHIGFAPKLKPEDFKAPFTTAEGWGTYAQTITNGKLEASLELKAGQLRLQTMNLTPNPLPPSPSVKATLGSGPVAATCKVVDGKVAIQFPSGVTIPTGQKLSLVIS
jgi:uncharacterized protein (DUF608 family)